MSKKKLTNYNVHHELVNPCVSMESFIFINYDEHMELFVSMEAILKIACFKIHK